MGLSYINVGLSSFIFVWIRCNIGLPITSVLCYFYVYVFLIYLFNLYVFYLILHFKRTCAAFLLINSDLPYSVTKTDYRKPCWQNVQR